MFVLLAPHLQTFDVFVGLSVTFTLTTEYRLRTSLSAAAQGFAGQQGLA